MNDQRFRNALALSVFLGVSCTAMALDGEVKERITNTPIAKAFVVATWIGQHSLVVDSRTVCYHIAFARTDDRGWFSIPDFSGNVNPTLTDRRRDVDVYAPGYELAKGGDLDPRSFVMVKRSGPAVDQFYKVRPASTNQCTETTDRRLLPMFKAVRDELTSLASTKEQRRSVIDIETSIDIIELGDKVAGERHGQRLREFFRREAQAK